MDSLSIKIKGIRLKKGFSQEFVADKIGMTQSNYARLESGKSDIKFERLAQIATAFEMTIGSVIDYDGKADLPEDGRFYYDELQKTIKENERLKEKIADLESESDDEQSTQAISILELDEEIKELKKKIKLKDIELLSEKEERKKEVNRVSEEKERLLSEKERLIEEKERTIQIMQKLIEKQS